MESGVRADPLAPSCLGTLRGSGRACPRGWVRPGWGSARCRRGCWRQGSRSVWRLLAFEPAYPCILASLSCLLWSEVLALASHAFSPCTQLWLPAVCLYRFTSLIYSACPLVLYTTKIRKGSAHMCSCCHSHNGPASAGAETQHGVGLLSPPARPWLASKVPSWLPSRQAFLLAISMLVRWCYVITT